MIDQSCENILVGGLEAGGTRFNCVIGYGNGVIIASQSFSTTRPQETLAKAADFFEQSISAHGPLHALGIAHFGPIEIDRLAENYGKILTTPKPDWSDTDIVGFFSAIFDVPIAFQSDVNVAAMGEHYFGAAKGIDNFVYITVGTGIGGGVFVNGQLLHNRAHPEIGHMRVPHDLTRDDFKGCCQFHGDCLEGLASGIAIENRWGSPGDGLTKDHPAWELEAHYLALLCVNLTSCYAPEKIIFGGGVMLQKQIITSVRERFLKMMQGYMPSLNTKTIEDYIVLTPLDGNAATKGALLLAQQALVSPAKSLK